MALLHLLKGRSVYALTVAFPAVIAGTTWTAEVQVWDDASVLIPTATLDTYTLVANVRTNDKQNRLVAQAAVTKPSDGVIRWSFADAAFTNEVSDVYQFTLDATLAGATQRLVSARLPVSNPAMSGYCGDY